MSLDGEDDPVGCFGVVVFFGLGLIFGGIGGQSDQRHGSFMDKHNNNKAQGARKEPKVGPVREEASSERPRAFVGGEVLVGGEGHQPEKRLVPSEDIIVLQEAQKATEEGDTKSHVQSASLRKLAWGMVLVSFVLYAALFLIPFLSLGAGPKLVLFVVLFVASEITFWGGGWILGKEVLHRYRAYLNPFNWWKKKNP